VVPHEHPVPSGFFGVGGQAGDDERVGEIVEERQPQRRADAVVCGVGCRRDIAPGRWR
jgi:hypothetical protein